MGHLFPILITGFIPPLIPVPAPHEVDDTPAVAVECPQLYISLDESREARMVHVWADAPLRSRYADTPAERDKLDRLNAIRERLDAVVCDWDDFDARETHRIPQFSEPRYRFSRYGEWRSFPHKCWVHPEFSLRWLDYERQRWGLTDRVVAWDRRCDEIGRQNHNRWIRRIAGEQPVYNTPGWAYFYASGEMPDLATTIPCPVVALPPSPADLLRNPLQGWGE